MNWYRRAFNEVTVVIPWVDDGRNLNDHDYAGEEKGFSLNDGVAEVMVHVEDDGRISRAYTYADMTKGMPRRWISRKKSLNPAFVDLSAEFIYDFGEEIREGVSDEAAAEAERTS